MGYIGNAPYQGVIDSGNIVDGSIQTGDIANSAVTTAKISDSSITTAKINDSSITVAKVASDVTQLIASGGGPKITGITITNSSYTLIDDTAVDTAGGYIKITGTGFVTGCSVVVGTISASSVTFTSSTELRVQLAAGAAGTYVLYVVNPDGGTAIRVNAVTYSATPSWVTSSTLPQQDEGVAVSIQLSATSATSYALQAGSTLPSGLTLASSGLLSGTVSGLANDTSYNFTVVATDAELQDSPRAFNVTVTAGDQYFRLTTLLINSDTAPNVLTDASSNNFNLIAYGDSRASNFTPYGTGWSNYFDGNGDYLSVTNTGLFGSGDWTVELWINAPVGQSDKPILECRNAATGFGTSTGFTLTLITNTEIRLYSGSELLRGTVNYINTWAHVVVSKKSGTTRLYLNGTSVASTISLGTMSDTTFLVAAGYYGVASINVYGQFYISGLRVLTGTGYDTSTITIPTTPPTAITNTSLLICNSNRFVDSSPNNFTITRTGDVAVRSFNPFNLTNTGTSGSMYFDGTDDYVTVGTTASNAFAFSGDFTIEAWFYKPGNGSDTYELLLSIGDGNGINGFFLEIDDTRALAPRLYMNNGALVLDGYLTSKINDAQWHHIACVRSGSNCAMFYDGTRVATSNSSVSLVSSASPLYIGRASNGSANDFYGYISDVRIINGTAAYNPTLTTITVPTQPLTAVANTSLLTLQYRQPHNNSSFQDSSSNQFLITRNGNATQGTFSPFSQTGWGNYFDGADGSNLSIANSSSLDQSGDFTQEVWYCRTGDGFGTIDVVFIKNLTNFAYININQSTGIVTANQHNVGTLITGTTATVRGLWYHIALTRSSNSLKLFVNGVQEGSTVTYSTNTTGSATSYIGGFPAAHATAGYLSNLRVTNTAVYTGNFTPPTAPLTAISGTSLLTCQSNRFIDNSSNSLTITRNGDTSVVAFSPFAPTAVYSPAIHGGSMYLDGTGDYINTSSDIGFNLGAGNFTWEFWTYLTASPADGNIIFQPRTPAGIDAVLFGYKSGSNFTIYATTDGGASWNLFSNTAIIAVADVLNRWAHWSFIRNGSTYTVYVDGISRTTGTSASQISQATNVFTIGNSVSGYFSGFRFVKGQALSSGNFTPPVAPLSVNTVGWTGANVAATLTGTVNFLLNFTNAAVQDATGRNVLETVNDSKVSTVQKKYSTGSMYFDGTGDYVFAPSNDGLAFGLGDFTIEMWCYWNNVNTTQTLFDFRPNATNPSTAPYIELQSNGTLIYYVSGATRITTSAVNAGSWTHIAISRNGTNTRLFINGTQSGATYTDSNVYIQSGLTLGLNRNNAGTAFQYMNGYIDDLRITKFARYTANFTPPAQTFKLR